MDLRKQGVYLTMVMPFIRDLKRKIRSQLAYRGYSITKSRADMYDVARRTILRHPRINTVIDVGASDGRWAEIMMECLPECHYLLIEAQPVHEPALQEFKRKHAKVDIVLKAAGDQCGEIYFNAKDPLEGQASYTPYEQFNIRLPLTTIDAEIQSRQLPGPYLLKTDTHGFEIPILKGAIQTLQKTEAIIMECYNFPVASDSLFFYEMCAHLTTIGFRCIDLVDPTFRPYDGAFWQMDLVFARQDHPAFKHLRYT